ncbi:hypothetical protein PQQ96_19005 [Paraburkholderia sediminicola]|uniref:hypothetical protein n=1 Tax=Paraburkholderia sediminicola TaxID=458836 RepID=UPI0038BD79EB
MTKMNKRKVHRNERRRLTSDEIKLIATLIKGQAAGGALTWIDVVGLGETNIGYKWTRQTLQAQAKIKDAYDKHGRDYKEYRATGKRPRTRAPESVVSEQKLDKAHVDIAELRETIRKYDELLFTYLHNALRHGISAEQLGAPLLKPFRAQSDRNVKPATRRNSKKGGATGS